MGGAGGWGELLSSWYPQQHLSLMVCILAIPVGGMYCDLIVLLEAVREFEVVCEANMEPVAALLGL